MSSRGFHRYMSLAGEDFRNKSRGDMSAELRSILSDGIHGLCFSAYDEHQKPGDQISEPQIRDKLEVIKDHTGWIRSFSCTDGNEQIPILGKELGLKTLVGAWIGRDEDVNEREIAKVIELALDGYADIVAVGNEVMYRKDHTEEQLLDYLRRVKAEVTSVPVGYVDAYYEFENRPAITDLCDVLLANCYPFWEGCSQEHALLYMKDMYRRAERAGSGKKVIITETGWPNIGTTFWGSVPSPENAMKYFINTFTWAREEHIEVFYFSAFDEVWKVADEGDVGAYWGLWDKNGSLKY